MGVKASDLWQIIDSKYYQELAVLVNELGAEVFSFNKEDFEQRKNANLICAAVNAYKKRNGKKELNQNAKRNI